MLCKKIFNGFFRPNFCKFSTEIKSFDAIPGPKSLPIVGTSWMYLPIIGKYQYNRLHHIGLLKLKEFGPLIKEEIMPGVNVVWVFKPEDIEIVYRCEGQYPQRRSHLVMEKYRNDRPHLFNSGGLLPTNGSEWGRIRKIFQKDISKIQNVRLYLANSDKIIKKFLNHQLRNDCQDLLPELSRLFLELIGLVCFDESLNCFEKEELKSNSRTSNLIKAAASINSVILRTEHGLQLWKYFNTPAYRKFSKAHSYIESVAKEFLAKKLKNSGKNLADQSILQQLLQNKNLDQKDILGFIVDMLLAGIDTLAYTSSFALYHLAKNMKQQKIMFSELNKLMTIDEQVTEEMFKKSIYTKAVIKEIHRLNPISIGVGRILYTDAVLSNYSVPAGTIAITQNQVSCRLSEYFSNPNEFVPERWLRASDRERIHPFLVLPFGYGPRACIARRLAEQNLQLLLMNAVRMFKLNWAAEELDCISVQINKPDKPVRINFEKRF